MWGRGIYVGGARTMRRARNLMAVAAIASLTSTAAGAATNLIQNGSFEFGAASIDPFITVNPGDTSINDWAVTVPNVDYIGNYWQAANGVRSIDLSGYFANGMIQQTINTVPLQVYTLTYWVSANPDQALPNPRLGTVFISGNPTTAISYTLHGNTLSNMQWAKRYQQFTATAATTNIGFSGVPNSNLAWGIALDNVSVSAVPEPAIWTMMIVGFGMLGFAMRRRSESAIGAA